MIHWLLILNRQGKIRVAKWYSPLSENEKKRIIGETHRTVVTRDDAWTNFIEVGDKVLVYRRYAGLFFCVAIDRGDNELGALECIHLLVETLDKYFKGVCELDLVFNFWLVYTIVDEIFLAGEIMESAKKEILERIKMVEKA